MAIEFPPEILEKAEAAKNRLDIHIHYSPHGSREDLTQAENLIRSRQFDIYAPESAHGTPQTHAIWKKVSNGDAGILASVSEVMRRHKAESELASIAVFYASKMPLIFPDITDREDKLYDVDSLIGRDLFFEFDGFENDLQRTKEEVHKHAKNVYYRDHLIATRLPAFALDAINATPRLKHRDKVKVLSTLGSRHTMVSHLLRKNGQNVSRSFNVKPFIFSPLDSAARQVAYGRVVPDNMYMDVFKQFILHYPLTVHFHNNRDDNSANFALARKAVNMLSDEDAKELYGLLCDGSPRYKELGDALVAAAGE